MTRKPNFWKLMLGLAVIGVMFMGTWATTRSAFTRTTKINSPTPINLTAKSTLAMALPTPTGTDLITGVIELDGNITDAAPGPTPDDWDTLNCDGGNAIAKTGVLHDGLGTSIFTGGGSKDPDLLASWKWKDGSVPDKDEIINAYAAKYNGSPSGDNILAFGADRFDNSGTAFIGFWFFKNPVFPAADGKFRQGPLATDALALHAIGDVLVLIEFTQGGSVPTAKVFEWVGSGGSESGGTLNDITGTAPVGSVFSISNAVAQQIPTQGTCPGSWQYTPKGGAANDPMPTNTFFEGAINIDAFPALSGSCFSSFLVETRSSASVTATLKDFVLGQFDTCPEISVTKVAADDTLCDGDTASYEYTVTNPTGFDLNVTLVDDNETPGNAADDLDVGGDNNCAAIGGGAATSFVVLAGQNKKFTCTKSLGTGTHTNVVTAVASLGGFTSTATATETVTVTAIPDVSVSTIICLDGVTILTATDANATGATFSWKKNGVAFGTGASINIDGVGTYQVTATTANGCTDTASRIVSFCSDTGNNP